MSEQRRKARPIAQLLDDPNRGIHKTYGFWGMLSKLFRIMLKDNKINGYRYYMLMDRFIKDPANRSKKGEGDYSDNRGNLNKEFSNPLMSWKVFGKGLRFQQIVKVRVTIEAEHSDGHISVHRAMSDLKTNTLLNDPRFQHEIEAAMETSEKDPNAPNMPVPDDQENIPFLDPDHNDDDTFSS